VTVHSVAPILILSVIVLHPWPVLFVARVLSLRVVIPVQRFVCSLISRVLLGGRFGLNVVRIVVFRVLNDLVRLVERAESLDVAIEFVQVEVRQPRFSVGGHLPVLLEVAALLLLLLLLPLLLQATRI